MRADLESGRTPKRDQDEPIQCLPPFASSMRIEGRVQFGSESTNVHYPPYVPILDWIYTLVNATMQPGSRFKFCSENKFFPEQLAQMLHMLETYVCM